MTRRIEIVAYDPDWAAAFATEHEVLSGLLLHRLESLHHIGSTAVPGLPAKPVIDMLGVLADGAMAQDCAPLLAGIGYEPRGEAGIPGRAYFRRERHHLHIYPAGHRDIARHLRFRDFLRAHPDTAEAYAALKQRLALRFGEDRRGYAEAKTPFCRRVERAALEEEAKKQLGQLGFRMKSGS